MAIFKKFLKGKKSLGWSHSTNKNLQKDNKGRTYKYKGLFVIKEKEECKDCKLRKEKLCTFTKHYGRLMSVEEFNKKLSENKLELDNVSQIFCFYVDGKFAGYDYEEVLEKYDKQEGIA